jgi:hypothetical protein
LQHQVDVSYPKGQRHYWKSAFLKTLSDDVIDLVVEAADASPSPLNVLMIGVFGGAVARVPNYATAFGHRDALFSWAFWRSRTIPQSTRVRGHGRERLGRRPFRTQPAAPK